MYLKINSNVSSWDSISGKVAILTVTFKFTFSKISNPSFKKSLTKTTLGLGRCGIRFPKRQFDLASPKSNKSWVLENYSRVANLKFYHDFHICIFHLNCYINIFAGYKIFVHRKNHCLNHLKVWKREKLGKNNTGLAKIKSTKSKISFWVAKLKFWSYLSHALPPNTLDQLFTVYE